MFIVSDVAAVLDGSVVYRPNAIRVFDVPDNLGLRLCATHGARRAEHAEAVASYVDRPTSMHRDELQ